MAIPLYLDIGCKIYISGNFCRYLNVYVFEFEYWPFFYLIALT